MKSLMKYIKREWKKNSYVLLTIIVGQACLVLWGVSIANLVTALAKLEIETAKLLSVQLLVIFMVWMFQLFFERKLLTDAVQSMDCRIREDIAQELVTTDYLSFNENEQGVYLSWLTNDIMTINQHGFNNLEMMINQAVGIALSVSAIVYFHYSIIVVIVLLFIAMVLVPKKFSTKMTSSMEIMTKVSDEVTSTFTDVLHGFNDLSSMNLGDYFKDKILFGSYRLKKVKVQYAVDSGKMISATNGLSLFSQIILLVFTGYLYVEGYVPIGAIGGVQFFAATIFSSLTGFNANYAELKTVQPVFEKYSKKLKSNCERNDGKVVNELTNGIWLQNIHFSYPNTERVVLENMNMEIKKGDKVVITAESGKGKSTLLNIMNRRLEPTKGNIYWDNISYKDLDITSLHNSIIYIDQNPHLFNATIRENIILNESIEEGRLENILKQVGLSDWIDSLELGLETIIDYQAKNISGGQKQKIILARGLLRNKKVVLLDEITSSLDNQSALEIEKLLFDNDTLTVVMVTHHLSEYVIQRLTKQYVL